jgi:hypothetical protein
MGIVARKLGKFKIRKESGNLPLREFGGARGGFNDICGLKDHRYILEFGR